MECWRVGCTGTSRHERAAAPRLAEMLTARSALAASTREIRQEGILTLAGSLPERLWFCQVVHFRRSTLPCTRCPQ